MPSFERAQEYLLRTIDETVSRRTSYKLDRMRVFLRELGDPQRAYPTVHVGGTSGKGSTCTMIARALQESGKKTGLHTKPHLHDATERARIDGVPVGRQRFAALLETMMPAIGRVTPEYGRPTYYETLLALAFLHFANEGAEVAAIEVGLGGRLDGTNVIVPHVSAITSIGLDHTEVLGETLQAIAREKGGIAKAGVPFVVAEVAPEAMRTLESCALEAGAPLVRVRDVVTIAADGPDSRLIAITARARYDVRLGVRGSFQRVNAATAIAVLESLPEGLRPEPAHIERALSVVEIPGRMEVFEGDTPLVLDIAHNPEKARALTSSLRALFGEATVHYVVAIGERKDAPEILAILGELPCTFTFTTFDVPGRPAIDPAKLRTIGKRLGRQSGVEAHPPAAVSAARARARTGEPVVVTGSTFVVSAVRDWLCEADSERSA